MKTNDPDAFHVYYVRVPILDGPLWTPLPQSGSCRQVSARRRNSIANALELRHSCTNPSGNMRINYLCMPVIQLVLDDSQRLLKTLPFKQSVTIDKWLMEQNEMWWNNNFGRLIVNKNVSVNFQRNVTWSRILVNTFSSTGTGLPVMWTLFSCFVLNQTQHKIWPKYQAFRTSTCNQNPHIHATHCL